MSKKILVLGSVNADHALKIDTFNGAMLVALAEGKNLTEAVTLGNAAAALSVTRAGAQSSIPHREETELFLLDA